MTTSTSTTRNGNGRSSSHSTNIIATTTTTTTNKKKKNPINDLIAGGIAGLVESSVCHPLDTIKTRMQLRKNQVESVPQKIQHSLIEPALRLKHSMQEPALRFIADPSAAASASTIRSTAATATASATATATLNIHEPSATFRSLPTMTPHGSGRSHATIVISPSSSNKGTTVAPLGPFGTAKRIIQREGFISLYKGLSAVYTGTCCPFGGGGGGR
jgi:hypothetical protein